MKSSKIIAKNVALLFFLLTLIGCRNPEISINNELGILNKNIQENLDSEIELHHSDYLLQKINPEISYLIKDSITQEDAIKIALLNNKQLQSELENIAIAKADLLQAGKFTNPNFGASISTSPLDAPEVEHDNTYSFLFSLDDLWQVPLKQRVSKDKLTAVIYDTSQKINNLVKETKIAFNKVIFNKEKIKIAQNSFKTNDKLDINLLNKKISLEKMKSELNTSLISLKLLLGLPSNSKIKTKNNSINTDFKLANLDKLIDIANKNNSELKIYKIKMDEIHNLIKHEESRLFKNVRFGVYLEDFKFGNEPGREGHNQLNVGPAAYLEVPIFDQNQAQIAKANFLLEKAKKEYISKKLSIESEISKIHSDLNYFIKTIDIYKNKIIPQLKNNVEEYNYKLQYLDLVFEASNKHFELENLIGKKL